MKSFRRRPLADVLDATQVRSIGDSHCLVIGGAGNLGGHLVRLLLETGASPGDGSLERWVRAVTKWDFERVVPAHLDAPLSPRPEGLRRAV